MKKYTEDHEWVELADGIATLGISDHAQSELGDIVYVELPEIGTQFDVGDEAAVIESVKAAGELYCPVSGEVVAVNEELVDQPGLINTDAETDGWIIKVKVADESELDDLLDEAGYQALIDG